MVNGSLGLLVLRGVRLIVAFVVAHFINVFCSCEVVGVLAAANICLYFSLVQLVLAVANYCLGQALRACVQEAGPRSLVICALFGFCFEVYVLDRSRWTCEVLGGVVALKLSNCSRYVV